MYNLDERCKMVWCLLMIDSPLDTEVLNGDIRETSVFSAEAKLRGKPSVFELFFHLDYGNKFQN